MHQSVPRAVNADALVGLGSGPVDRNVQFVQPAGDAQARPALAEQREVGVGGDPDALAHGISHHVEVTRVHHGLAHALQVQVLEPLELVAEHLLLQPGSHLRCLVPYLALAPPEIQGQAADQSQQESRQSHVESNPPYRLLDLVRINFGHHQPVGVGNRGDVAGHGNAAIIHAVEKTGFAKGCA